MLIAVACTVDSRFSAVTMISSSPALSPEALPADVADVAAEAVTLKVMAPIKVMATLKVMAQGSARTIDAWNTARMRNTARMYVANNIVFMARNLPGISKNRCPKEKNRRPTPIATEITGLINPFRAS